MLQTSRNTNHRTTCTTHWKNYTQHIQQQYTYHLHAYTQHPETYKHKVYTQAIQTHIQHFSQIRRKPTTTIQQQYTNHAHTYANHYENLETTIRHTTIHKSHEQLTKTI